MQKPEANNTRLVPIADIHITPFLQTRGSGAVPDVVRDYAELLKAGVEFPPVVVYELSDRFKGQWTLAVGFHRIEAHKLAGVETIQAEVRKGKFTDAWLASWLSNTTHGVRYSNNDKREAVKTALKLFPKDSPTLIAEKLGVSDDLVRRIRRTLIATGQIEDNEKLKGRDGRERTPNYSKDAAQQLPTSGSCQQPESQIEPVEPPAAPEVDSPAEEISHDSEPAEEVPTVAEEESQPEGERAVVSLADAMLADLDTAANAIKGYRPYKHFAGLFRELDALRADLERDQKPPSRRSVAGATQLPARKPGKLLGVGVVRAHEALAILSRIPKNDALREDGFQLVEAWMQREEA